MALKSQWDFGELFPIEATRRVLTVSEVTTTVRRLLEKQVGQVWVTGEITNLRVQSSGHAYFAIKDTAAQLACVMFRGEARGVDRDLLRDGLKVVLQGELTVYEARGQYQLHVTALELQGVGALQAAFERLKQKLQAQGLFAPERKRPLPRFPRRIGVVTSPTGAALLDVIHVVQRRDPGLQLILAPCRVQGPGAAEKIADAIRLLNAWSELAWADDRGDGAMDFPAIPPLQDTHAQLTESQSCRAPARLDLILVTRGGGSLEDLWAFNEEPLARAIFESELPVVSAVGHEIDFTISDFVADVRAATPSAAAELITADVFGSRGFVAEAPGRLAKRVRGQVETEAERVSLMLRRLGRAHPHRRLQEQAQRLDDLQTGLARGAQRGMQAHRSRCERLGRRIQRARPFGLIARWREDLDRLDSSLSQAGKARLKDLRNDFESAANRLCLLSPHHVLERGYSITCDAATGRVIRSAAQVSAGQVLETRLKSGSVRSVVDGSGADDSSR